MFELRQRKKAQERTTTGYEMACLHCLFIWTERKNPEKMSNKKLSQFWQRAKPMRFQKRCRVILTPMTAWRLDQWHVSTMPRRKHAKQFSIQSVFTTGCSWGRAQILLHTSLNLKRQPVTSFILDLFLSPVWILLPSLCCLQRLLKRSCQLWKRWAARAGVLGWTSVSERSYFFYHPHTFCYIPDDLTRISLKE